MLRLFDRHLAHEPVLEVIDVEHLAVGDHVSVEITHDLVNADGDPAVGSRLGLNWVHARVDLRPLPLPVGTDVVVAVDEAAPSHPFDQRTSGASAASTASTSRALN